MANEVTVDENGKEVRSLIKKVIEPRPHPEDLTRVQTGPEIGDYEYADPVTLFQLERLVPALKACTKKGDRYQVGKVYPKAVREMAARAEPYWPAGGYVQRSEGAHLAVLQVGGAFVRLEEGELDVGVGDNVLPFPPQESTPAEPDLVDPQVPPGEDPEVELSGALPIALEP